MKFGEEWRQMNQLKKFLSCLISLRLPNNNTNQIQSSLPNGKIDFDLICCGLGRPSVCRANKLWDEWNELSNLWAKHGARQHNGSGVGFGWPSFLWIMGWWASQCSAKEKTTPTNKTNGMSFLLSFLHLIDWSEAEWNQIERKEESRASPINQTKEINQCCSLGGIGWFLWWVMGRSPSAPQDNPFH